MGVQSKCRLPAQQRTLHHARSGGTPSTHAKAGAQVSPTASLYTTETVPHPQQTCTRRRAVSVAATICGTIEVDECAPCGRFWKERYTMSTDTATLATTIPMRLGHSPDSDDAFMFYGLAENLVDTEGLQ